MKKIGLVLCMVAALATAATVAEAIPFTEQYTGNQTFAELTANSSFYFNFDFVQPLGVRIPAPGTNAPRMSLTADAVGAGGPWNSATLTIGFGDLDPAVEQATIDLTAFFPPSGLLFPLGTITFQVDTFTPSFTYEHLFSGAELSAFALQGWGSVSLLATLSGFNFQYNDMKITDVGIHGDTRTVPEPVTLLLLGAGLLGVGITVRRRKKA